MFKASFHCMINKKIKIKTLYQKSIRFKETVRQMRQHSQRLSSGAIAVPALQTVTRRQPADYLQMSGAVGSLHTPYLRIYLLFLPIFIHLYAQI